MRAAILGVILLCFGTGSLTRSFYLWRYFRSDEEIVTAAFSVAIMVIGVCVLIPPIVTLGDIS